MACSVAGHSPTWAAWAGLFPCSKAGHKREIAPELLVLWRSPPACSAGETVEDARPLARSAGCGPRRRSADLVELSRRSKWRRRARCLLARRKRKQMTDESDGDSMPA